DGIRARSVTGVQTCALPISYRWLAHHRYLFWAPTETANLSAGHRSRAAHVLRRLGELSETEGRVGEGEEPPGVHRLVVNALLDEIGRASGREGGEGTARPAR